MANVIKTVSELLLEITNKGVSEIEPFLNIGHNPMIGSMYEGLTQDIARKAIFDGLDLKVVSGKITNKNGDLSRQIDCMIVVGNGTPIPYTDQFIYNINQVVMVIEVKKNLYTKDLSDGYDNLKSVCQVQDDDYREISYDCIDSAFRMISGKPLPDIDDIKSLDFQSQMLYHVLVIEALLPLRVIFGYSGFADEISLRNKFCEYLNENSVGKGGKGKGYGPQSFPNLIICGNYSIVKTNGFPYAIRMDAIREFPWMASYRRNPILIFLELLWTRLREQFNLPNSIFGDEIQDESLAPLLTMKCLENARGWEYTIIPYDKKNIAAIDSSEKDWEPKKLSEDEFVLMSYLCNAGDIEVEYFKTQVSADKGDQIIEDLSRERLIYVDNGMIKLLTKSCRCVIVPGYGEVAADDNDGRLTNWLMKKMAELRRN